MGALVGLGVGVGLLLIWSAFFLPREPRKSRRDDGRLAVLLARAGLPHVSPRSLVALCLGCAALAAILMQAVSRTPPVAVAFGAMAGYLPVMTVAGRARRRQREFAEVWPEAVDHLASAVRAGLSLPDAVSALGVRGPLALREPFSQFALDYQLTGRFGDCLDRLKVRLADPVGDRVVEGLRARGVQPGDRVAAIVPNVPDAIVCMLAATALGATWSSCSPDFGTQGILDRFDQIAPTLLFAVDGYYYNGKLNDIRDKVAEIGAALPGATMLADFERAPGDAEIPYARLPFNHPLYILYSSGTTGKPKCIVHGAGGTLLQHLKEHQLHADVKPGDRLFYFTTCGWMMWNWLVSGLASGATLMLYDGSPFHPDGYTLFDYCAAERFTHLGVSAKFIQGIEKFEVRPNERYTFPALRAVLSTGSVLLPEGFDYVYAHVKQDVCLSSVSGGTDIISCFIGGNPNGAVHRGELQAAGLGMATDVFDADGQPVRGEKGELVCTRPFPSMPIGFWGDEGDRK